VEESLPLEWEMVSGRPSRIVDAPARERDDREAIRAADIIAMNAAVASTLITSDALDAEEAAGTADAEASAVAFEAAATSDTDARASVVEDSAGISGFADAAAGEWTRARPLRATRKRKLKHRNQKQRHKKRKYKKNKKQKVHHTPEP